MPPSRETVRPVLWSGWTDRESCRPSLTCGECTARRVSPPDGGRLALSLEEEILSIWVHELARDRISRVSYGTDDHNVAWSPDGSQVAFESGREGVHQIYLRMADGSGEAERITSGEHDHYLCDWSPDGQTIAYVEFHPTSGADVWVIDRQGRQPRAFLNSRFAERDATFSPNGRWLAYASDESGQHEVYVQPFPGPGSKWMVSSGGGEEPAWSRSGKELFYRSGGRVMAVTVSEFPEFTTGRPEVLFEGLFHYANFPTRSYDVGPDGRFVMVAEVEPEFATRRLGVMLNWSEVLKQANR